MMKKMSLQYRLADRSSSCMLSVLYSIESDGDSMTLRCYIEASHPHELPWLQNRNFVTKFLWNGRLCLPLASETDYEKTADALLLMDNISVAIMKKESILLQARAAAIV